MEKMQGLVGKKIFVGLSGGVDSAVTAALLQQAGAHVTGVFIKGWYPPGMPCTWSADRRDAMRVAAHLRIPFLTLDASKEYKEGVIDYLLREYKAGRTPNPDIMCNREVKFGAFAEFAFATEQGADFIATGHYAQTTTETVGGSERMSTHDTHAVHLFRGVDADKDQSYFLWAIPKTSLERTLFPVGGIPKSRVRELAKSFSLPNAAKRDSQGICFLGAISVEDFLLQEFGSTPGDAVLESTGVVIGTHNGAILHTLGERVHLTDAPPGPWYVVGKDIVSNTLIVSNANHSQLMHSVQIGTDGGANVESDMNDSNVTAPRTISTIPLLETNFFTPPEPGEELIAQYRYHGPKITGICGNDAFTAFTTFTPSEPLREAVASGQSLVLYRGEECIGGGIIA